MQDYEVWSETQLAILKDRWCHHSDKELAVIIGRSAHSIRHKRCDLGLIRTIMRKRPKECDQPIPACPAPEHYYRNWATEFHNQVAQLKKRNGTYKEKKPCPTCNRTPCICRSAKLPFQISWI